MGKRKVVVVTDSGANLPSSLVEKYGIEVIPLWIHFGNRAYRDGIDIQPREFFRRLREWAHQVRTSQPSLGEFLEFYRRLKEKAEAIVSVHLTGRYSGVVSVAKAAAAEMSPFPIEVVDTGTISMAQGFVVLAAARLAAAGASFHEVVERARNLVPKIDLIAVVDSLEYAVRGGRLAWAARLVDNLLRVKPMVRVRGNDVGIIGQARTRAKAIRRLISEVAQRAGDAPLHIAVLYSGSLEEARRVQAEIANRFRCAEIYLLPVAPALGVHAGPDALGLAFYAGE
ncbi:MAG TPA: DegV family protein [Thermoflexia bacterium]|jgi:DegV family protein with EDD domain|nr:DegV family protein [Thermoflexia bacterium]